MNKKAEIEVKQLAKIVLWLAIFGILAYGIYYFFNKFILSGA
jgi:hypothetical protein